MKFRLQPRDIPNILSCSRIILVVLILLVAIVARITNIHQVFLTSHFATISHLILLCVIGYIGLSDMLDGHLARRFNWQSQSGKRLDELSDKVSMLLFVPFAFFGMISSITVALIILRDVVVTTMRYACARRKLGELKSDFLGKCKTCIAFFALFALTAVIPINDSFISQSLGFYQLPLYLITSFGLGVLFLWSGLNYFRSFLQLLTQR